MSDEVTEPGPEESVRCRLCTAERSCGGYGLRPECLGPPQGSITGRLSVRDPEPYQLNTVAKNHGTEVWVDYPNLEAQILGAYSDSDAKVSWQLYNAFRPVYLPGYDEWCD